MGTRSHRILMLAAENDLIPGGKVGGIGDVLRDVPQALAANGCAVDVLIPAYGSFHRLPGASLKGLVSVKFRQSVETLELYELDQASTSGVRIWVIEHALFSHCGVGQIYCSDPPDAPFASDANKFALFCLAASEAIKTDLFGQVDTLHLHDWHTALVTVIRAFDPLYECLRDIRCVFSIHNLALQGIRPLTGQESSLEAWFPELEYSRDSITDPRWPDCVNPVAAAIRLADSVHTVSKTYAEEIQQANDVTDRGFHGGEGLEVDIRQAAIESRLTGILNGCDYSVPNGPAKKWPELTNLLGQAVRSWIAGDSQLRSSDYLADQQLVRWNHSVESSNDPFHIVTSIGRLTEQKVQLLTHKLDDDQTVLDRLLDKLGSDGVFILLGTGEDEMEQFMLAAAAKHQNFLFLNRYAQSVADLLYANGTLFLMPSSFEPCGISQMIAMKHGQPCLVHAVGGLKDTVTDGLDGFQFSGSSVDEQSVNLLSLFEKSLELRKSNQTRWLTMCERAAAARFSWQDSAQLYIDTLY